jgi:hypothetical protein
MQVTLKLPDDIYDKAQEIVRAHRGLTLHQALVVAVHVGLTSLEGNEPLLDVARLEVLDLRVRR